MENIEVIPADQADGPFSSDDIATLNETRRLRKLLVKQLVKDNQIPEDKSDKILLVNLINGLDAEVMTRARVKVAAKTEEALTDVRHFVAQALLQHNSRRPKTITSAAFEPPPGVERKTLVPGEAEIGVINLTMSDIEEN